MNVTALALLGVNYALVMSLPFVFFERLDRRRASMWWVSAAPFVALPDLVALAELGLVPTLVDGAIARALSVASVLPCAASIALVASALGANRRRLAQWHQRFDAPRSLETRGPYARVRHPFYLAYLLMFLAAALIAPNACVIGTLAYAVVILNHTAAREERRICASDLGDAYRDYMSRTRRFLPARRPA
jgi:protein-S-isoprenylcysteine O-methyltransferase Ste14